MQYEGKKIVIYALKWSFLFRCLILYFPFKYYRNKLGTYQKESIKKISITEIEYSIYIRSIVISVCNKTPWKSKCLIQAMICKQLLKKNNIESTIFLGIKFDDRKGKIISHAWLKVGHLIITGAKGHELFKVVNYYS